MANAVIVLEFSALQELIPLCFLTQCSNSLNSYRFGIAFRVNRPPLLISFNGLYLYACYTGRISMGVVLGIAYRNPRTLLCWLITFSFPLFTHRRTGVKPPVRSVLVLSRTRHKSHP